MSFVKIWVHLVFSTKNREPYLKKALKDELCKHIKQNCKQKDIFLKEVNGHKDHLHCLISLGKNQTIAKITQLIKGESSFWINKHHSSGGKFSWQDDYFAVSVSESQLEPVSLYIRNQEDHHTRKTFAEEIDEFMENYGWERIND